MKEKLIIRNFGPIKEVDLDLGKVTVLIGEQATGKSTVAKVLAVCRYFSYIFETNAFDDYIDGPFLRGLKVWGLVEYLKEDTYIYYSCYHYDVTVEKSFVPVTKFSDDKTKLKSEVIQHPVYYPKVYAKSTEFKLLLSEYEKIKPDIKVGRPYVPNSFFLTDVKNVLDNPFYLPTERGLQSVFSIGQSSIPNLANFLFNYFSKVDVALRSFTQDTPIFPVDIAYKNNDGSSYIRKKGEEGFFLLVNAASGYQSVVPIVLVIKYQNEARKKKKTFIIEEPELNLFPSAQNKLIQYLTEQVNKYDNSILLTTHSPYTITSLNNLMYAYQVGQEHPEEVSKEIDKKYWINPDDVSCYRMLNDGKYRNIIDSELKQIDAGEIDEVSREINSNWDKLANIEYNKTDEN